MQDRFKFRVWLKDTNKMYNVHSLHIGTNKAIISSRRGNVSIYINKNSILMQSTGLKDKNGKLIYEGDIIKYLYYNPERYTKWIVVFNPDTLEFGTRDYGYTGYQRLTSYSIFNNKVEVIGNIYENPELLEVEND